MLDKKDTENSVLLEEKILKIVLSVSINGDWASGYWGVGGYGGLLKRVKRSLLTFPDAQYPTLLHYI